MRVQFEDGGGPNAMALLWDDRDHQEGNFGGQWVVPARDLLREASFTIGGDPSDGRGQPLTISGTIGGSAALVKIGASELTLVGANRYAGGTRVDGGTLIIAGKEALPAAGGLRVAEHARVRFAGDQRLDGLSGGGDIELGGGLLTIDARTDSSFVGAIHGPGSVLKTGGGALALGGHLDCPVRSEAGTLRLGEGGAVSTKLMATLRSPLATIVPLPSDLAGQRAIAAEITVPDGAPADLGYGVWVSDQHGHWFQRLLGLLPRGVDRVRIDTAVDPLLGEPRHERWQPAAASSNRSGLFFWSATRSTATLGIEARLSRDEPTRAASRPRLLDLRTPTLPARTGERLEWLCRPEPFPANPYDPDEFALDAVFTGPDGVELHVPGFYLQRMRSRDRGDREDLTPTGEEGFALRLRPRLPGRWKARLEARWKGRPTVSCDLPDVAVAGERWDGYLHVDQGDPRFFAVNGGFCWPVGMNIRSVCDPRDHGCLGTKLTPERGALAYDAYLDRLAAAGGTAIELWLAAWNLGMEWRADWYGFYGIGRYNQENAWRLDEVLDHAWSRGIRVNVVVMNHGQGSNATDHEWENSPWNVATGGPFGSPDLLFTDPAALRGQENYRRWLVGRYADHPAVLGWKLWSEINLTAAGANVVDWHQRAVERWHRLDPYGHPVSTHWAGDYGAVDRRVGALLDYVCIDAYHSGRLLAELIADGVAGPNGLGKLGRPILVTEYGGSPGAGPKPQILAELASGPWAGFVSGNGGSPMTWWHEFVDQQEVWKPYGAIRRFTAGEDLRGADAHSVELAATSSAGPLWCRAWQRPTRLLGYCIDRGWGMHGGDAPPHQDARITIGPLAAGSWTVEWWNADEGAAIGRAEVASDGATPVTLTLPKFERHLAFKLWSGPAR
jgi:autotransporter-associated beta strand protein